MKQTYWFLGPIAVVLLVYLISDYFHFNRYFCKPILIEALGYEIRFPQTLEESIRKYDIKEHNKSVNDTIITAYTYPYDDKDRFLFYSKDSNQAESIYSLNFSINNSSPKETEDLMRKFSETYQTTFQKTENTRYGKKDTFYYYQAEINGCISVIVNINDYSPLPVSQAKNKLYISFLYLLNSGEVQSAAMNYGIVDKSPYGI
ncbi:MAG: hypothetical protein U0X91_16325 [Spirosomataceae bacterium]